MLLLHLRLRLFFTFSKLLTLPTDPLHNARLFVLKRDPVEPPEEHILVTRQDTLVQPTDRPDVFGFKLSQTKEGLFELSEFHFFFPEIILKLLEDQRSLVFLILHTSTHTMNSSLRQFS